MSEGFTAPLDLSAPRALALTPGQTITLRGEIVTRHDGTSYDAAGHYDGDGAHLGGAIAIEGTGLRLTKHERGFVQLVATGDDAPGCRAMGVGAPCLVPRTTTLAHERLLSLEEFAGTLSGGMLVDVPVPVAPPLVPRHVWTSAFSVGVVLFVVVTASKAWRALRARPLSRIARAARDARRAVHGQPTEAALLAQIAALTEHAHVLEAAERKMSARIRTEEQRGAAPGARAASELDRLRGERDRARSGLGDIEAALRVLALKTAADHDSIAETARAITQLEEEIALGEHAAVEASLVTER